MLSCVQIHLVRILLQTMQRKWAGTKIQFIRDTLSSSARKLDKMHAVAFSVADSYNECTKQQQAVSRQLQDDIAFVKAFVPRQCMSISEDLRRVAGGLGFLESSRCAEIQNGGYGPIVAEGDSHLMAQLWMKNNMVSSVCVCVVVRP